MNRKQDRACAGMLAGVHAGHLQKDGGMARRQETIMAAMVNNKGGVGKTTSAVSLAAGIAAEAQRVLLADLDVQGNASLWPGMTRADLQPRIVEVIPDGQPIREATRPNWVAGRDILAVLALTLLFFCVYHWVIDIEKWWDGRRRRKSERPS